MLAVVVVPCLNEEETLRATCRSLGFGLGAKPPPDTVLIIVDNASTDRTPAIIQQIVAACPPGSVRTFIEACRGHVQARRLGVEKARTVAAEREVAEDETLIIQADADTIYSRNYTQILSASSNQRGSGVLIEAYRCAPVDFAKAHSRFIELCQKVDSEAEAEFAGTSCDVIVDDKACAYRLSDYFAWGGLTQEYTQAGEEVLAESSRLYIRGRLRGASRYLVKEAVAYPSRRKIYANPALHFATAGFPREHSWCRHWIDSYRGPNTLEAFEAIEAKEPLQQATSVRLAHCTALFSTVPRMVNDLRSSNHSEVDAARIFEMAFSGID